MSHRSRPRGSRRGPGKARPRHPRRGEPLSGGFVEIGEVAGWIASEGARQATELSGPIEVEHYCSHLASMWESATPVLGLESSQAIGYGVALWLREAATPVALVLLRGLAATAAEPIDELAAEWSDAEAWGEEGPDWLDSVGAARATRAGRFESEDGATVLLDLAWPCGERGGVGVFIDHGIGGIAKHVLVGPPIEETVAELGRGGPWKWEELSVGDAATIIGAAMERTEGESDPPVGDTYISQRGFLRCQLNRIAEGVRESDTD